MAGCSKLPGAENEELIVHAGKYHPNERTDERPNDEEHLEVKMECHAWPANVMLGVASVGGEWPSLLALALDGGHEDPGAVTPVQSRLDGGLVNIVPAAQIHHPHNGSREEHDEYY
jgi:hypothetical protein